MLLNLIDLYKCILTSYAWYRDQQLFQLGNKQAPSAANIRVGKSESKTLIGKGHLPDVHLREDYVSRLMSCTVRALSLYINLISSFTSEVFLKSF
jgi:hypothetical protein